MQVPEREFLKRELLKDLESSIDARLDRFLEVRHQGMVPNHHFAIASSECVSLYRDGYFLSAVMVSQAVSEGIWKFVLERNHVPRDGKMTQLTQVLLERGIISQDCADAFVRIWSSFRNDLHHMNPPVKDVPVVSIAKQNLANLTTIEREIFGCDYRNGQVAPTQPKYWDLRSDGTAEVFLRFPTPG